MARACSGRQHDCTDVPLGACKPQAPPINGASLVVRPKLSSTYHLVISAMCNGARGGGSGRRRRHAQPRGALEGPRPARSRGSRGLHSLFLYLSVPLNFP